RLGSGAPLPQLKFTVASVRVSTRLVSVWSLKYWPVRPVPVPTTAELTVKVAVLLVALPAELVTTTRYCPASAATLAGKVRVAVGGAVGAAGFGELAPFPLTLLLPLIAGGGGAPRPHAQGGGLTRRDRLAARLGGDRWRCRRGRACRFERSDPGDGSPR